MSNLKQNHIHEGVPCISGYEHSYKIIKGSGKKTGTPLWKCTRCKRKTTSS